MKNIFVLSVICGLLGASPAALCESADHPLRLARHKSNSAAISSTTPPPAQSADPSNAARSYATPPERSVDPSPTINRGQSGDPSIAGQDSQAVDSSIAAQHGRTGVPVDGLYDGETVPFVDNFNYSTPQGTGGNFRNSGRANSAITNENFRNSHSDLPADQFPSPKTSASNYPSDPSSPSSSSSSDPAIAQLEYQMWQKVNRDRVENGSRPIPLDLQLSKLARDYAEYMMRKNFFAHVDPKGRNPEDRAHAVGIASGVYENISWLSRDGRNDLARLEESEADMMAEPRNQQNHRSNILGTARGAVGIGVARNGGKIYMVQEYTD